MINYFFTEEYVKDNLFKAFEQMTRVGNHDNTIDYKKL
jgi:hypothetical protein